MRGRADAAGMAQGRDTGAVERLADVDVAQPRDDALVQQRGLDRRALAPERAARGGRRERVAERFGAEVLQQPVRLDVAVGARSIAPKRRASLKVMRAPASVSRTTWSCFSGAGWAWWKTPGAARSVRRRDDHAARHAEMDDQRLARGQIGEDVFRPAAQPVHARAGQPLGHMLGEGPAQVGAVDLRRAITAPSSTGARPRRTVSTSGSSGKARFPLGGPGCNAALRPLGRSL
jgi:hypothetical protein